LSTFRKRYRKTYIILATIDPLPIDVEPASRSLFLLPTFARLTELFGRRNVHGDPDVAVEPEYQVDAAWEGVKVGLETRNKGGREGDEGAVSELWHRWEGSRREEKEIEWRIVSEECKGTGGKKKAEESRRTFPYLSERVWSDMVPSPISDWTSATSS
jgi:hypothetical protein